MTDLDRAYCTRNVCVKREFEERERGRESVGVGYVMYIQPPHPYISILHRK